MQMGYLSPAEAGPKSMEALMKAVELDSNNAEIVYSQACINTWVMWDWKGGETGFKKSIELSPNHTEAHAYYSHFLNMMGRQKEAKEQIEMALKLDPYNPLIKSLYCIDLNFMRRHDDAGMVAREALSMDPTNPVAHSGLLDALHLTGDYKEAWEAAKIYYTISGYGQAFNQDFVKLGYTDALNKAAEALSELSKTTYVDPTLIYQIYLMAGNSEQTFKYLQQAFNEHNPNLPYILLPIYDILRDDPRFQEIAGKMNLPYK